MSEGWETDSGIRLALRTKIRQVIDDWVLGPVELLDQEDLAELRAVLRAEIPVDKRSGYLYACWRVEIALAIGVDGDATRTLRGKAPVPGIDLRGMTQKQKEWVLNKKLKIKPEPNQAENII